MVKLFWRNQDEDKVKKIHNEEPSKIIALAYISGWDADTYVVADNIDEYNEWVKENIPDYKAGWVTTDIAHIFK